MELIKTEMAGYVMVFILFILQILDAYTTHTVLNHGGYEANSIAKFFMQLFGSPIAFLLIKIPVVTFIGYNLMESPYVLLTVTVVYFAVIVNNFNVISKLKS